MKHTLAPVNYHECLGKIKELRVLSYADDAAMTGPAADQMSKRLTAFANEAKSEADMKVKMSKTYN